MFLAAAALLCAAAVACLFISGSARPLISMIYGARWLPSAAPLVWLAMLAAIQVFFFLAYDLLVVLARSRFLLTVQLIWLIALVPALIVGSRADGIAGASIAELLIAAVLILPIYIAELAKADIRPLALLRRVWIPAIGGVFTGLAGLAGRDAADERHRGADRQRVRRQLRRGAAVAPHADHAHGPSLTRADACSLTIRRDPRWRGQRGPADARGWQPADTG